MQAVLHGICCQASSIDNGPHHADTVDIGKYYKKCLQWWDVDGTYSAVSYTASFEYKRIISPLKKLTKYTRWKIVALKFGMYADYGCHKMTNLCIPGYIKRSISSRCNPRTLLTGHPQHYKASSEDSPLDCVNSYPRGSLSNYLRNLYLCWIPPLHS